MKNLLALFLLFTLAMTAKAQSDTKSYGEEFVIVDVQSVRLLIENPEEHLNEDLVIRGTLTAVCQKAGCWARIGGEKGDLFMKFGDHDFTIPTDMAGAPVVARGTLIKKETSVEELKHLAEDAGKSKREIRKIKSPKIEYWFMATGLEKI